MLLRRVPWERSLTYQQSMIKGNVVKTTNFMAFDKLELA